MLVLCQLSPCEPFLFMRIYFSINMGLLFLFMHYIQLTIFQEVGSFLGFNNYCTQYTLEQLQKNPLVLKCRIHNFIFYLCFLKAEYTKTLAIVTNYCRLYSARTASQNLHAISNQSAKLNYNGGHAQNGRLCWTIILWLNIQSKNRTFSSRESNTITRKRLTLYLMSLNL